MERVSVQVIIGGDFNVDFARSKLHNKVMDDFCSNTNLFPVYSHHNSSVDLHIILTCSISVQLIISSSRNNFFNTVC